MFDPLGRLYASYSTALGSTYFQSDGQSLVTEYGSGAVLLRRYVHGPGVDDLLVWYEGSGTGTRRWFHQDERGSVIAVSDASGNLVGIRNRYDEYGTPQGALTGRFGYTGQMWLPEIGMYHYRARTYNPSLGRFMQTDPVGYEGGMNLYAYVGNDPVNFTDPLGLQEQDDDEEENIVVTGTRNRAPQNSAALLRGSSGGSFGGGGGGGASGGEEESSPDRCAAQATDGSANLAVSGTGPTSAVLLSDIQAMAQAKFLQHSWPLGPDGRLQSTFSGFINSGERLALAAGLLLETAGYVPAGLLNVRVTGDMTMMTGYDSRSGMRSTSFLTVILSPIIGMVDGLPRRVPVSMFPGCP